MTAAPKRTMVAAFDVVDGQLAVGGVPLERLTAQIGSTPFFAYDRRLLTERVAHLRATLPPRIELGYAMKANPMPAVVQHLAQLVDSIDVASALEMRTALDTPMSSHQITFAGPGKTDAEINQAVAAGVLIEMESRTEVRRVLAAGEQLGVTPRVALRINPDFAVKGSGMRMGGGPQQFGIDAEEVPDLLADLASTGLDFVGFHVFAGSQNLHADILCEAQRRTVDLVLELAHKAPSPVTYLNLGGGFGIPYFDKDEPLDLVPIAENLYRLLTEQIGPQLPEAHTCLELGRYLVGEAGVYVTRVVDCKESRGQLYVVVDGGLHHQLAASGNFGQVIRRNYPIALGNRIDERPDTTTTVVGCLCTPLDLLGDRVELPNPRVGDLVVLFQAGAYGLTASPTAFLGHPAPMELLL
jgi:diaminopimelate decarboxylase